MFLHFSFSVSYFLDDRIWQFCFNSFFSQPSVLFVGLPDFCMVSCSASESSDIVFTCSSAHFASFQYAEQHVDQKSARYSVQRFIVLSNYSGLLSIFYNHHSQDTAPGALRKQW